MTGRTALLTLPLAMMLAAAPALAQDARIRERLYDPTEVVTVNGRVNVQATIMFGEGEVIENVAIGDSASWQVTPNKRANLLFVKPLKPTAKTNMTVVTDRRAYLFDLVAGTKAQPLYVLQFTYPEPIEPVIPPDEQLAAAPGSANATELTAARDPYAVVDPASLNFDWQRTGDAELLPDQAYDDGDATFLTWPRERRIPAILVVSAKGVEGPVNYAVRGDTIVVDGVPPRLILRSGDDVAELVYAGPDLAARRAAPPETSAARNGALAIREGAE